MRAWQVNYSISARPRARIPTDEMAWRGFGVPFDMFDMEGVVLKATARLWRVMARCIAVALVFTAAISVPEAATPEPASAASVSSPVSTELVVAPDQTRSYYERNASAPNLYLQGQQAGRSAAQGIVILDFGRPAVSGSVYGTFGYSSTFIPFVQIMRAVEGYIKGYYAVAPRFMALNVAIGTNNSCGTGQPCGSAAVICGCQDEPANFTLWGEQLARTVEDVGAWTDSYKAEGRFTDDVRVVAADDIEPAFDPRYLNTYDLLKGYADAVGGYYPPMVDYGSADANVWTDAELFQVAYGFRPDVPMPEIYFLPDAQEWASLLRYAKARSGQAKKIYGVLTEDAGPSSPEDAYAEMVDALAPVTDQRIIPWLSTITPATFVPTPGTLATHNRPAKR